MFIKYTGGRSRYEINYGRKAYHFVSENNRTIEVLDKNVINYIFSLPNRFEFSVVDKHTDCPIASIPDSKEISCDDIKISPSIKKIIKKAGRPKKEK